MAPTIDPNLSLIFLYEAILFTYVRLKLDPRIQAYVPVFEQLLNEWWVAFKNERAVLDEEIIAEATTSHVDHKLDRTSDAVAGIVLIDVGNNRRSAVYKRYFPNQSPSRFKRPKLNEQLTAMRAWPPSLLSSPNPALNALGAALVTQIEDADEAIGMVSAAKQKITDSRTTGERKQFFDKVNGARKKLHGDVSQLVHDHPEWNLPRDYADTLFQHDSSEPEPTIAELDQKIESATAYLEKLKEKREERLREEQDEAKERTEAEKKAQQAELDMAAKAAAEANARLEQLKAKLGASSA